MPLLYSLDVFLTNVHKDDEFRPHVCLPMLTQQDMSVALHNFRSGVKYSPRTASPRLPGTITHAARGKGYMPLSPGNGRVRGTLSQARHRMRQQEGPREFKKRWTSYNTWADGLVNSINLHAFCAFWCSWHAYVMPGVHFSGQEYQTFERFWSFKFWARNKKQVLNIWCTYRYPVFNRRFGFKKSAGNITVAYRSCKSLFRWNFSTSPEKVKLKNLYDFWLCFEMWNRTCMH